MDEIKLMMLIAEGEHKGQDFKREIKLDTKEEKGEFVKDVISIANTAPDGLGYLLVGVDDDGLIVGTKTLEEERLQQIVHRYIRPPVVLKCMMVCTNAANNVQVGVIEIQGKQRPYSICSPIGKWEQDAAFVRHGTVVMPATTDEISQMNLQTLEYQRIGQFIKAAEKHTQLGDYSMAIAAYTEAIKLAPSAKLFLARGRRYVKSCVKERIGSHLAGIETFLNFKLRITA